MELIIELKVYKLSIGAACGLEWPPDRIIIQVLDDSTDPIIKVGYLIYIPRSICFHFQIKIFFSPPFHQFKSCCVFNPGWDIRSLSFYR